MSRILARALVAAAVAALALSQLERGTELLVWELLLLGVLAWMLRGLPESPSAADPPLFDLSRPEPGRLPRAVSSTELSVIDVVSGHLGPERRLQPLLQRLARQRLAKKGIELDSPAAVAELGEQGWTWLADPGGDTTSEDDLAEIVTRLERL